MERRDLLRFVASLGAGTVVSTLLSKRGAAQTSVRYQVYRTRPRPLSRFADQRQQQPPRW